MPRQTVLCTNHCQWKVISKIMKIITYSKPFVSLDENENNNAIQLSYDYFNIMSALQDVVELQSNL